MSKTLKIDDVNAEKEKLEGDRAALLKNLEEYQKAIQQTSTQIQAIGGAIQTCDYFINKINPPQNPETIEETEVGDEKE
jgi:chromosome segregation ATPase